METKLIVGLGNPGMEYKNNRHNVGFMAVDMLCEKLKVSLDKRGFNGNYGFCKTPGANIIIAKPNTYMNLSGEFVTEIAHFYKISLNNILIIYDDMDTEVGKIRIRAKGSSGGQNGIKNIIQLFGKEDIPRIRIGIGKPNHTQTVVNWVLGNFPESDKEKLTQALNQASDAAICFFDHGIDFVMNHFNK